jgi:cation transporter-like permease
MVLLVLLLIIVPIIELAIIIQVGSMIGVWWTIALLVADSLSRMYRNPNSVVVPMIATLNLDNIGSVEAGASQTNRIQCGFGA